MTDQPARRLGSEYATPRPDTDGIAELVRQAHEPRGLDDAGYPRCHTCRQPTPHDAIRQVHAASPYRERPYTGADAHLA